MSSQDSKDLLAYADVAAEAWIAENWESRFGELGSWDFAREAFKAGALFREPSDSAGPE